MIHACEIVTEHWYADDPVSVTWSVHGEDEHDGCGHPFVAAIATPVHVDGADVPPHVLDGWARDAIDAVRVMRRTSEGDQ